MADITPELLREETIRRFIADMGHEATDTNIKQVKTYMDAFDLFIERNAKYQDLWREYGWEDTLMHVRSKMQRMQLATKDNVEPGEVLDDAFDLINYGAFFIRNVLDPLSSE